MQTYRPLHAPQCDLAMTTAMRNKKGKHESTLGPRWRGQRPLQHDAEHDIAPSDWPGSRCKCDCRPHEARESNILAIVGPSVNRIKTSKEGPTEVSARSRDSYLACDGRHNK
jgi:hypothetical protein